MTQPNRGPVQLAGRLEALAATLGREEADLVTEAARVLRRESGALRRAQEKLRRLRWEQLEREEAQRR